MESRIRGQRTGQAELIFLVLMVTDDLTDDFSDEVMFEQSPEWMKK